MVKKQHLKISTTIVENSRGNLLYIKRARLHCGYRIPVPFRKHGSSGVLGGCLGGTLWGGMGTLRTLFVGLPSGGSLE